MNMTTPEGKVPLVEASINWFNEGVKILIQGGADVNKFCPYCDETPLMVATSRGNTKITELLLEGGADVNSANSNGYTALMEVASRVPILKSDEYTENYLGCPKILLRYGAKINYVNIDSHNALYCVLHRPIRSSQHSDICRLLFVAGETLDGITGAKIPVCLKFDDVKLELKYICREVIRKHLLNLDPHTHLLSRVPRLGLPSLLTEYLLHEMSLDDDIDDNSNGHGDIDDGNNENND